LAAPTAGIFRFHAISGIIPQSPNGLWLLNLMQVNKTSGKQAHKMIKMEE
jgi:hypothetical protein